VVKENAGSHVKQRITKQNGNGVINEHNDHLVLCQFNINYEMISYGYDNEISYLLPY